MEVKIWVDTCPVKSSKTVPPSEQNKTHNTSLFLGTCFVNNELPRIGFELYYESIVLYIFDLVKMYITTYSKRLILAWSINK